MFGQCSAINGMTFGIIALALCVFGALYNALVEKLGEHKEGYTSLFVAFGVFVTIMAGALFYPVAAAAFLVLFAASGTPMIIGDIARYQRRRREAIERMRLEAEERLKEYDAA